VENLIRAMNHSVWNTSLSNELTSAISFSASAAWFSAR
jgi:hypothetical protein